MWSYRWAPDTVGPVHCGLTVPDHFDRAMDVATTDLCRIHQQAAWVTLLSALMAADLPVVITATQDIPTVLACETCEVTWRDIPGAPCWFCGGAGHIANPERLVLD